jgi:hypothetical protein
MLSRRTRWQPGGRLPMRPVRRSGDVLREVGVRYADGVTVGVGSVGQVSS